MADDKRDGMTRELIAEAEALRSKDKQKSSSTRQLVRDAERLIGREAAPAKGSMKLALIGAAVALLLAILFFVFAA